ncbi:MAG TPA: hypothetical protein VM166_13525 [Gemmatimonadaceae bacterium]|nr:hypothetical protein [Gemmatimonadaceae bacterium]
MPLIVLVAIAPILSLLLVDSPVPLNTRFVGWFLWIACLIPSWQYFRQRRSRAPIPFMPVIGVLYLLYYARPLVFGSYNQHWRIRVDPETDYNYPAQLALEGWVMLLLGWQLARPRLKHLVAAQYDDQKLRKLALIFAWFGPLAQVAMISSSLPLAVAGLARFFATLGYMGMGLLTMIVASKKRDIAARAVLLISVPALFALQLASGTLSLFVTTAALLIFSVWAVRGRLSPIAITAAILMGGVSFVVKGTQNDYRRVAWISSQNMTNGDRLALLGALASKQIQQQGVTGAIATGGTTSGKRSANMDLMADVVRRTPSYVPFWGGQTYISLVGLAIPRFLWPNKPTKRLGQDFGHRYGLLDSRDTGTSINLPFLIEFYANFGEAGVVIGMLIVGLIYGTLARVINRHGQTAFVTMTGIVLYLPLLNIESDFSLTFGGLLLNGFALWCLLRGTRSSQRAIRPSVASAHYKQSGPYLPLRGQNAVTIRDASH